MASKYFLKCSATLVTIEIQIELLIEPIAPQEE